jgi:hypothetical protein
VPAECSFHLRRNICMRVMHVQYDWSQFRSIDSEFVASDTAKWSSRALKFPFDYLEKMLLPPAFRDWKDSPSMPVSEPQPERS